MATLLTKRSNTSGSVPLAAQLTNSTGGAELAVNTADKRLYVKDSGGTVVELGISPGSMPTYASGTANGVTYLNGSKVLTSGSALTFDGTTLGNSKTGVTGTTELLNITRDNSGTFIKLVRNAGSGNAGGLIGADSVGTYYAGNTTANSFYIDNVNTNLQFYVGSSEGMRLTSTGLGIGTSSPYSNAAYNSLTVGGTKRGILTLNNASGSNICQMFVDSANVSNLYSSSSIVLGSSSGANLLTYDSSGNLGLGVTPNAGTSGKVVQITNAGHFMASGSTVYIDANAYFDSGWKYITTAAASNYYQNSGAHIWQTAASGTAGNAITFTQAMTLDASGQLGVGTTSPSAPLHVSGSGSLEVARFATTTDNTPSIGIYSNGSIRAKLRASSAETALLSQGALPLLLGTNDTERARITSGGDLLVGTTTTRGRITSEQSGGDWAFGINHTNAGTQSFVAFRYAGTLIGQITGNNTNTSYTTSSDYRLKENIQPMTGALAKVAALKPVTYKWKSDGSNGEGFIAHELAEVCPGAVSGEKDAVNEDGSIKPQGIDTSFLVATLTAAIQELKAEFDAYKATHP